MRKFIALTSSSNYERVFSVDFAKKLLFISQTYSPELISGQYNLHIYTYFQSIFESVRVNENDLEKVGIISPDYVKSICDEVFSKRNEYFSTSKFGGGEFPFIIVYKDSDNYYYNITR